MVKHCHRDRKAHGFLRVDKRRVSKAGLFESKSIFRSVFVSAPFVPIGLYFALPFLEKVLVLSHCKKTNIIREYDMYISNLFRHLTYQIFSPGTILREKYDAFKSLLKHDKRAHELMAELEEIYHDQSRVDFTLIEKKYQAFSQHVSSMIQDLIRMCPTRYHELGDYFKKLDAYAKFVLAPSNQSAEPPYTMLLNKISRDSLPLVGSKTTNLAIIGKECKLPIPRGFVITGNAFFRFITFNHLRDFVDERLSKLDIRSSESLEALSNDLMGGITRASIPPEIEEAVTEALKALQEMAGPGITMAVRSSAMGEDTRASFAGQYRTVLHVRPEHVLNAYKEVVASKYSPGALYYRINYGLSDLETPMAVMALEMVDAAASGVMYTQDLDDPGSQCLTIHTIWGLGELLVSGDASPDVIKVSKERPPRILDKKSGDKTHQMIFSGDGTAKTVALKPEKRQAVSLDDKTALLLAEWGKKLENHFGEPQDIEWCKDEQGNLLILQSRPLKHGDVEPVVVECNFQDIDNAVLVSEGERACGGIGGGRVFKIEQEADLKNVPQGAVLVSRNAAPQYVSVMDRLNAVVTDLGSTAGHFASVAREFGVPSLLNTRIATVALPPEKEVTVYADGKMVYEGLVQAMLKSPCAKRDLLSGSPFARKIRYLMNFVSPLKLVDPKIPSFKAGEVRSLHDILRFTHEKAVQEMFHMGEKRVRKIGGSKKLLSSIPMLFYVMDVGGGLTGEAAEAKAVREHDILSRPMKAVLKGLNHPDIHWGQFSHFDWSEYDRIVMSGGIISADDAMFASYAVLSRDYLNLNLKFGYHFVILDSLCGESAEENYILFRFAGGAADLSKRSLRANFLEGILKRLGFNVDKKADLVDAKLGGETREVTEQRLDMVGRLLGATRLMDMYLKDIVMVEKYVDAFFNGRYHFESVEGDLK